MKKINIQLFGVLADIAGASTINVEFCSTGHELVEKVINTYPLMKVHSIRLAVNEKLISNDINLSDADSIALMPPFSGG